MPHYAIFPKCLLIPSPLHSSESTLSLQSTGKQRVPGTYQLCNAFPFTHPYRANCGVFSSLRPTLTVRTPRCSVRLRPGLVHRMCFHNGVSSGDSSSSLGGLIHDFCLSTLYILLYASTTLVQFCSLCFLNDFMAFSYSLYVDGRSFLTYRVLVMTLG